MLRNILHIPAAKAGQRIAYGEDPNQFGELRMPDGEGPHPLVIFIHGGFWKAAYDLAHTGHLCVDIVKAGYAVWNVEYRRIGQPGGGYPGTLDDIRAAAQCLTQIPKLDLNRVIAAGHSAGGQLALWLAASGTITLKGVAGLAAVSDLRRGHSLHLGSGAVKAFLGCGPEQCDHCYAASSPMEMLPLKVPQVLLHGTLDKDVPSDLSRRFVKASPNARLVVLRGAGHFEPIDPRTKYWPVVRKTILGLFDGDLRQAGQR